MQDEHRLKLRDDLVALVAEVAEIDAAVIQPDESLSDLGVDSLMSFEIAVQVEQRYGVQFSDADLRQVRTFGDLYELTRGALAVAQAP